MLKSTSYASFSDNQTSLWGVTFRRISGSGLLLGQISLQGRKTPHLGFVAAYLGLTQLIKLLIRRYMIFEITKSKSLFFATVESRESSFSWCKQFCPIMSPIPENDSYPEWAYSRWVNDEVRTHFYESFIVWLVARVTLVYSIYLDSVNFNCPSFFHSKGSFIRVDLLIKRTLSWTDNLTTSETGTVWLIWSQFKFN